MLLNVKQGIKLLRNNLKKTEKMDMRFGLKGRGVTGVWNKVEQLAA
jgi:hypothetical protein